MRVSSSLLLAGLVAAGSFAQAQTYGTSLEGENVNPPVATAASGVAIGERVGVPIFLVPSGVALPLAGAFENLESDFVAAHLHSRLPGQATGPIECTLVVSLDDNRGGTFDPNESNGDNTCPLSFIAAASLDEELLYVDVHTVDNPGGEVLGVLRAIPTLDGDLRDPQYELLATARNTNGGFSGAIDLDRIVFHADLESEVLFLGLAGHLRTDSGDGFALWLNFSELTGAPAGTALGQDGIGASHYMNGNAGDADLRLGFAADFEVDYMFAVETGSTDQLFLHGVSLVGTPVADYLGTTDLVGTAVLGPTDEVNNVGGAPLFSQNNVAFAFSNAGASPADQFEESDFGLELAIPFNQLGLDSDAGARLADAGTIEAFAAIVSSSAYFSDVSVPGNIAPGNAGFEPDFFNNVRAADGFGADAGGPIGTGPFHSAAVRLPVELTAFGAVADGSALRVEWATAGETNNAYFDVLVRAEGEAAFREVGQVTGAGTTAEPQRYALPVGGLQPGTYTVRLTQVDLDGTTADLGQVEVALGVAGTHALGRVAPNPATDAARLALTVARSQAVEVAVYDVLGRRVQTLFGGPMEGGEARQFEVNTSALAPGAYVVRAVGEHFAETTRLTVAR